MIHPALAAALLLAGPATADPPDPFAIGQIDARPAMLASSVRQICYGDSTCLEMQDQARRALVAAYGHGNAKRKAAIAAALANETRGDQIDWRNAATDLSIEFATPPRGVHCTGHISRDGRDFSTACN